VQTQLLISISTEELKIIIKECLSEVIDEKLLKKEPPDELLSRKEVASLLQISLPTLHKKQREGKIPFYRMGTRILFKKSEVMKSLDAVRKYKR
jgi:excisionase family DNA binding protein